MNIGDLAVTVSADSRKFREGLQSGQAELTKFSTALDTAKKLAIGFFTFEAARRGVSALVGSIEKLDDLAGTANRLGVSTEFLSELQYAAQLSDTEIEALTGGIEKLEKNLGKATVEGSDLTKMLSRVGLDAQQLAKMGPEEAFLAIADAVSRIPDPFQRAAFATDVFGKGGQSLINILEKGRSGIEALRIEARRFGQSFNADQAEAIGRADDAIKRMKSMFGGLGRSLTTSIVTAFDQLINQTFPEMERALKNLGKGMSLEDIRKDIERRRMLPREGGAARPLPEGGGDIIDLGDSSAERSRSFKSFATEAGVQSKEGFSLIARALTKPGAGADIPKQQLAAQKKGNEMLANINESIQRIPLKVGDSF